MKVARRPRLGRRAIGILIASAMFNAAAFGAYALGLRVNTTASMPLGVYRITPYHAGPIARDALVVSCLSPAMLAVAVPRGYLSAGECPGHVEPLLKHAAAIAGDRVDVSDAGLRVNGKPLPASGRVQRDCGGRRLPRIAAGSYIIPRAALWLYAPRFRAAAR